MIRRVFALFLLPVLVTHGDLHAQSNAGPQPLPIVEARTDPIQTLQKMVVSADRVAAADIAGPEDMDAYDAKDIEDSGAFSVEEFISNLPPPQDTAPVMVLIDGRPTYLDPNSLPVGMIASIEVSDGGSMPQYGAYNQGRIINIKLKKDYSSREIGTRFSGALAGGGSSRTARFSGAINHDALRVIYSYELAETRPLLASARAFARNQDLRDRGGSDNRLPWGAPAVVASLSGPLTAVSGHPSLVLVPEGTDGTNLTAADFLPADPGAGAGGENQRRFNTSDYRWLVSPSRRESMNLGFTYTFSERLQVSLTGSHVDADGERLGAPPVTPVSDLTRVPASVNPFGQDVAVGLVHTGFGPTRQDSQSSRDQIGLALNGRLPRDWRWEVRGGYRVNDSHRSGAELDPAKFAASLQAEDPAQRFNPFVDDTVFATNVHLYPSLTSWRRSSDHTARADVNVSTHGPVFHLPGGPAQLRVDAKVDGSSRERTTTEVLGEDPVLSERRSTTQEGSSHLTLPIVSVATARPWARRLEGELSGEWERASDGGRSWEDGTGVIWAPSQALSLRARYQRGVDTPSPKATAGSETLIGTTLIDNRRGGEVVTGVTAFTRDTVQAEPEISERCSIGTTFEPHFEPGLRLSVSYRLRRQERMFQNRFDPQELVYNEAAFAGRVTRADATPADQAAGRPGPITAIDLTPGNTGRSERDEVQYELSYRPAEVRTGRWRFVASADELLRRTYEVAPGVPYIADGGGVYASPRVRLHGLVSWSRTAWSASARVSHVGAIEATGNARNGAEAWSTVDLTVGHRWRIGGKGPHSRRIQLNVSIGNLFDRDPPFADTVDGFRGGSALGRTYALSTSCEF